MALDKLTKIDGGGISTTSDYRVGVITATKFVGPFEGTITSTDANFTGNVSIAGTLTYEDVTNIDSVGIITARDGIFIPDNKKLELGNASGSGDLRIYHDSSDSYIQDAGTGDLIIKGSNNLDIKSAGDELKARFATNGSVDLYFNNNKRFSSSNYGTDLFGQSTAAQLRFKTQEGTNRGMIGVTNANVISILDAQDHNILRGIKDGAAELYYDNGKKLETNNDGIQVTGSTGAFLDIRSSGAYDAALVLTANNNNSTDWSIRNDESDSNKLDFRYNGNKKMHLTSSGDLHLTGEVGIGTDNPTVPLEVRSSNNTVGVLSSTDSGANLDLFDDDTQTRIRSIDGRLQLYADFGGQVADSSIRFLIDGNNEKLRIDSSGNILSSGNTQLFGSNTSDGSDNKSIMINGGGAVSDSRGGYLLVHGNEHSSNPGVTRLHAGNVGNAFIAFNTAGTERVRITSGGQVNIGGSTQTSKTLYVDGTAEFTSNITCTNQVYINGTAPQVVFTDTNQDSDYTIKNDGGQLLFIDRTNSNATRMYANTGGFGGDRLYIANDIVHTGDTDTKIEFGTDTINFDTAGTERLRITSDGFVGINETDPYTGLTINKEGDYWDTNGNTYAHPEGRVLSTWRGDRNDDTDYWVGFVGKYLKPSATVNILLQPHVGNFNNQAGMYIAGEATGNYSSDFTLGKIVSGNVAGRGTTASSGKRATKSELLRIKSNGKVGINSTSPEAGLDVTHNDGAYIKSVTNGSGAKVRFSDNNGENYTQIGTIEYKHVNNQVVDGTAEGFLISGSETTTAVQIDGLLKVTAQPCAVVYQCTGPAGGAANAASDNQEPLHFDHVHINQGGMTISNNNARIQVPVAGIYFVSYMVSGTVTNVDDNDGIELVLLRNGNEYPATNSGAEPVFNFGLTANEEEFFCNNTLLVSLSKDDYVEVAVDNIGNSDANINRGNFNVMLMS